MNNRRLIQWLVPLGIVTASVVAVTSCLVDSVCLSDSDCSGLERCDVATGVCFLECGSDEARGCPSDRPYCLEDIARCVECYRSEQCPGDEECVDNQCVPAEAPDFELEDCNANSPTFGESYELAALRGNVVLLFFADLS